MSGICGYVGSAAADTLERMLAAIDYRGDRNSVETGVGVGLGYRFWQGRPSKTPAILRDDATIVACAGTLAPAVPSPAEWFREELARETPTFDALDGAFAFAHWDVRTRTLTLGRDPFGVRSLYYVEHAGTFYFATELKQLLAIADLPVVVDPSAIHKYLTFSFVPGEAVPVLGVKRLLPGHLLRFAQGKIATRPYFQLVEETDETLRDLREAVKAIRRAARRATERRLSGEKEVGLFLSGGLDSSSVGVWLKDAGATVRAFSLDFGDKSVEREQAVEVARTLGMPQTMVFVDGASIAGVFDDVVHKLDLPFGDPVTGPQILLAKAVRDAGLSVVFNGEGGDQLFGGWTSKPMIAAEVYADLYESETPSREETYLRSYHRFYGLEGELYTSEFQRSVGPPGQRRAHLSPYLQDGEKTLLHRVRLADISLKGSQNILPRAERTANGWGVDIRTPLFDRELATTAFRLPPEMKLHGACEKYVLKRAMRKRLPEEIVWRRKFGMSVPISDFVQAAPMADRVEELLGEKATRERGWFQPEFIERLRAGQAVPSDTRRRRVGERIWTLMMLEAWMRRFIDRRGS